MRSHRMTSVQDSCTTVLQRRVRKEERPSREQGRLPCVRFAFYGIIPDN